LRRSTSAKPDSPCTPEACWDISQAYAFFAYAWDVSEANSAPRQGCEECSQRFDPCSRGTQKRVPPANFLTPLQGETTLPLTVMVVIQKLGTIRLNALGRFFQRVG
jgi:hypothetical protein